jgi:hypothetical protein
MSLLGPYERKARLVPGVLAVAPCVAAIVTLGLKQYPAATAVAAFVGGAGGSYLLSVVVGRYGRTAERSLLTKWGGWPTTIALRTRGTTGNAVQRDAWRAALTRMTGVQLLSDADELRDPARADEVIEAAVGQVKFLGHASGREIVASENAQYGFERNVYGFRWVARSISFAAALVLVASLWFPHSISRSSVVVGLVIDVGFLLFWSIVPSPMRVREAGDRYAAQLFNAVVREVTATHQDHV